MIHGSMTHDFTGRRIKKKAPKGETFQKYQAPAFQTKSDAMVTYRRDAGVTYQSADDSDGINTAPVEKKTYTGTLIKGISTLHKSNAVPIISQEEAIDIANMRRN